MSKRSKKLLIIGVILIVLIGAGGAGYCFWVKYSNPIPKYIRNEVSFAVFYPSTATIKVQKSTIEYSTSGQVISFTGNTLGYGGIKLVFSEQPTPSAFNDVPNYYNALLNDLNEYDDFSNINGQTYLTSPKNLNGNQSAVMNSKGTLMFVRAYGDLPNSEWEIIFNGLNVVVK